MSKASEYLRLCGDEWNGEYHPDGTKCNATKRACPKKHGGEAAASLKGNERKIAFGASVWNTGGAWEYMETTAPSFAKAIAQFRHRGCGGDLRFIREVDVKPLTANGLRFSKNVIIGGNVDLKGGYVRGIESAVRSRFPNHPSAGGGGPSDGQGGGAAGGEGFRADNGNGNGTNGVSEGVRREREDRCDSSVPVGGRIGGNSGKLTQEEFSFDESVFADAEDETLAEHDERFHGGHFDPATQSCSLRDEQEKNDDADVIPGNSGITPEEDAAYADAVKRGDRDTALRMIREAAAKAMPNTKVVDKDGLPMVVYHGSRTAGVKEFAPIDGISASVGMFAGGENGISLAKKFAKGDKGSVYACFLNCENPYLIDNNGRDWDAIQMTETMIKNGVPYSEEFDDSEGHHNTTTDYLSEWAKDAGLDSLIVKNVKENGTDLVDVYVPFSSNQVKSADITYDDNGKLIPLSKRFNFSSNDVRDEAIDLGKHDRQYHGGHYEEGDACKLRDQLKENDESDYGLSKVSIARTGVGKMADRMRKWLPGVRVRIVAAEDAERREEMLDECVRFSFEPKFDANGDDAAQKELERIISEYRNGTLDGSLFPLGELPDSVSFILKRIHKCGNDKLSGVIPDGIGNLDDVRLAITASGIDHSTVLSASHPTHRLRYGDDGGKFHKHGTSLESMTRILQELAHPLAVYKGDRVGSIAVRHTLPDEKVVDENGVPQGGMSYLQFLKMKEDGKWYLTIRDSFARESAYDYIKWENEGKLLFKDEKRIQSYQHALRRPKGKPLANAGESDSAGSIAKIFHPCQTMTERDGEYVKAFLANDLARCLELVSEEAASRRTGRGDAMYGLRERKMVTKRGQAKQPVLVWTTPSGNLSKSADAVTWDGEGRVLLPSQRFDSSLKSVKMYAIDPETKREKLNQNFYFMRNDAGEICGWYDRSRGSVALVEGRATPKTVAHELGWHATYHWAEKKSPELYRTLKKYASEATEDVRESVMKRYGEMLPGDVLLDEIGAERFTQENMTRLTSDGRSWWRKVKDGIHRVRTAFFRGAASNVLTREEISAIAHKSPKMAVEALVEKMLEGRTLGRVADAEDYLSLCAAEDAWVDSGTGNMAWKEGRKKTPKTRPIDRLPKKRVQEIVAEGVKLIKTLPKYLLPDVASGVAKVLYGRMEAEALVDWLIDECGVSEGRAYVIAIDQIRKAKERMKIADWKNRGIEFVVWRHRSSVKEPRHYHIADWNGKSGIRNGKPNGLNGFVFRLDRPPVIDLKTGARGFPADCIGCKCYLKAVKA